MAKTKTKGKLSQKEAKERLEKLIPKLKHLPAFTDKYTDVWRDCSELVKIIYPNQYVLTTKNFDMNMQHNEMSFINHAFKNSEEKVGYVDFEEVRELLTKHPLETEGMFRYVERQKVEYNFAFKQINAFTIIHDGEYAILLDKPNRHRRRFTLPGGHVDFDNNSYQRTMLDNVRKGAITEIFEELNFNKCKDDISLLKGIIKPMLYANYDSDWNKMFHSAFIFECKVKDVYKSFTGIKSGEPNRHDVAIVKLDELTKELSNCAWLDACLDYIRTRDTYPQLSMMVGAEK